ncbi:hypothetical protein [Marinobacter mobilis]|uniref:hypothetical protein n=1 Tax=Marinobacter mobilis TaxID=488533 RepID=UPI0035C68E52
MLGWGRYLSRQAIRTCAVLLVGGGLLVSVSQAAPRGTASAEHEQIRIRLAQFSVAGGRFAEALARVEDLDSPLALLLRAESLVGSGRSDQAIPILRQLTAGERYRGQSWLMLAEAAMNGATSVEVNIEQALDNAVRYGHGEIRERARFHQAELLRAQSMPERAGQVLATMEPGYWAAVGYQNVASDYARIDRSPARSLVALRVALALASEDAHVARGASLKSELLLQAGYLALQAEDFSKAEGFLKDIALDSYVTPEALFFHGQALAGRQNVREAMQSWHRAKKFPLAFPGAVEAWLGMGQGYDELGYLGQAGEAFLAANAAFDSEQVTLRSLAEEVRQRGAWRAMVEASRATDLEWFLADNRALAQPRQAYLLRFAESADGQSAIARVATLAELFRQLQSRKSDLEIFRQAIAYRQASIPSVGELETRLGRADGRIGELADRLRRTAAHAGTGQSEQVDSLVQTLIDLRTVYHRLPGDRPAVARSLNQHLDQLALLEHRLDGLVERLVRAREEAEAMLDRQMLSFLSNEEERIRFAQDRAEQQVVYLYEHLALRKLEQEAQP